MFQLIRSTKNKPDPILSNFWTLLKKVIIINFIQLPLSKIGPNHPVSLYSYFFNNSSIVLNFPSKKSFSDCFTLSSVLQWWVKLIYQQVWFQLRALIPSPSVQWSSHCWFSKIPEKIVVFSSINPYYIPFLLKSQHINQDFNSKAWFWIQ